MEELQGPFKASWSLFRIYFSLEWYLKDSRVGGQGTLLSLILHAYPELRGVLVERKSALKMAATYLEQTGVLDRCTLIEGSFFDPLPQGSDSILLSRIIHDWDDNHTLMILKNCFSALQPGGTLLLIELIVPENPQTDVGVSLNLNMLVMTGGQERTEEAYRTLLLKSGFENIAIVGDTLLVSLIKATKPPKTQS